MNKDFLRLEDGENTLEIGITHGYIDRVSGAFDFRRSKHCSITGYNLSLDIENLDSAALRELEKITNVEKKFLNAIISLDGLVSKGRAKIAQIFSFNGIAYDVEITE